MTTGCDRAQFRVAQASRVLAKVSTPWRTFVWIAVCNQNAWLPEATTRTRDERTTGRSR
jgi:hypothetical protein